jgi:hypothetical protein
MLYVHWKATSISLVREHPTAESLPDFPSVLTYSTMIALNMWLYLYIEVHQIRYNYNHRMDVSDDVFMRFWYNVWTGQTTWITTRGMPHHDDNDYDFDDLLNITSIRRYLQEDDTEMISNEDENGNSDLDKIMEQYCSPKKKNTVENIQSGDNIENIENVN